jgi:anti-sigma regulatory factor (Ser/Thr protein kinase)
VRGTTRFVPARPWLSRPRSPTLLGVTSGPSDPARTGLTLLRRLSAAFTTASTVDDVARAALRTALEVPGVLRAGLALDNAGGRQLQFVSTDLDALTTTRVHWCLVDAYAEIPLNDAVRTGADVYVATSTDLDQRYPDIADRQRQLGTRSLAALSLSTESTHVGGLLLCFGTEQPFDPEQRWVLGALASQMTQALHTCLAHQQQETTAEQLRRGLMPRSLPELGGLLLGAVNQPGGHGSEVGGDWYDVIPLADGATALVLGDVAGRGSGAALMMSEMRAAVRAYALLDPAPSAVLPRMDAFVESRPGAEQLLRLAYALVEPGRRRMTLALAGHPAPLRTSRTGATAPVAGTAGPALGLAAGPWPETSVRLSPGTVVLFYSDGVVTSRSDGASGMAEVTGLLDALEPRRRQPRELCARIAQLTSRAHRDDDVTLLAVAAAPTDLRRRSVVLPDDLTAPREARRFLRSALAAWEAEDDLAEAAELCVSELVTNAVIHAGSPATLTVQLDPEALTVLVHDQGTTGTVRAPSEVEEDPLTIEGRGLALVEVLSSAWAAEHGADGTTVWFELERPA